MACCGRVSSPQLPLVCSHLVPVNALPSTQETTAPGPCRQLGHFHAEADYVVMVHAAAGGRARLGWPGLRGRSIRRPPMLPSVTLASD